MKRHWLYLLVVCLLVLSLACGSSTPDAPPPTRTSGSGAPKDPPATKTPPPPPPTDTPPSEPPASRPDANSASLTLQNYSGGTVCYVRISPTNSDVWGEDWLSGDEVLLPDDSRVFEVPLGTYDLRLEDCNSEVLYEEMGIVINGDFVVSAGGGRGGVEGAQGVITLINQLDTAICYVFISPSSSEEWGDDRLGDSEVLTPGDRRDFSLPNGTYDVAALDCDENAVVERYEVFLDGSLALTAGDGTAPPSAEPPPAETVSVTLDNVSGLSICYVHIAPADAGDWGPDRLGSSEIVFAGESYVFQVVPGSYDLRAVYCEGENNFAETLDVVIRRDVTWTVGEGAGAQPVSVYFVADRYTVRSGECATLSWSVENAGSVLYRGQAVNLEGSQVECPSSSTLYPLEVEDLSGSWTQYQVEIKVETGY